MRYRPNPGFRAELRATPEFQRAMVATTRYVAEVIRFMALPYRNTGYYVQHVEERGTTIRFTDPFAHLSEWGSVHNPPQRNILRAMKAVEMTYRDARDPLG